MNVHPTQAGSVSDFSPVIEEHYYKGETYGMVPTGSSGGQASPKFSLDFFNCGATSVARFFGGGLGMRRSWKHIRDNASDLYVIWFPLVGQLTVSQDTTHGLKCEAGSFTVTCGDRPFHARAEPAEASHCEQIHLLVPSHLLRTRLPAIDRLCGRVFDANDGPAAIGMKVYAALFEQMGKISTDTVNKFALAALDAICEEIRKSTVNEPVIIDSKRANLEKVLRSIDQHLATQGLTAGRVAIACNMSRRYLHYLMKSNNITFGEYLWDARLRQAKAWLQDPEFEHFHIVDIAYMCGFRSSSHFSSAFKARFSYAPRDERASKARPLTD